MLVVFYIVLYWEHKVQEHFGVAPLTAFSESVGLRNRWYLYGFLYTVAICGGAVYYLRRHGNSRYNRYRISGQRGDPGRARLFASVHHAALRRYRRCTSRTSGRSSMTTCIRINALLELPLYFALYTIIGSLIAAPLLAVFYGKRWYCSWICGCGGLANTFGDPWRHLSSKSTKAWRFEQVSIHIVLFIAVANDVPDRSRLADREGSSDVPPNRRGERLAGLVRKELLRVSPSAQSSPV